MHSAALIEDLDLPGIRVNGNWRLTFVFRDGHVFDLDFEYYY